MSQKIDIRKTNILPIFSSHFSLGRSILTTENEKEIGEGPVSIFAIAQDSGLDEVYVVDNCFSGFIQLYKTAEELKINLRFGVKLTVCQDSADKSENSLNTEHKVIVWLKNSAAYEDGIKIYTQAATKNFYYTPRISLSELNDLWTNNLCLMTTPYDNFIHNNSLKNGNCIPLWGNLAPIISYANMGLPFDSLLIEKLCKYAGDNNLPKQEVHPIYYNTKKDSKPYLIFRCINNRTTFEKPNLDHFSSDLFSWEGYLEKINSKD